MRSRYWLPGEDVPGNETEAFRLKLDIACLASYVSRNSDHCDADKAQEAIYRLIGHMCRKEWG